MLYPCVNCNVLLAEGDYYCPSCGVWQKEFVEDIEDDEEDL